jgi:AraC-like DNA-binding protein
MLKETDMPIADVAEKLGFPDAKNLARVFRKEKGVTPYQYRMQCSPYTL